MFSVKNWRIYHLLFLFLFSLGDNGSFSKNNNINVSKNYIHSVETSRVDIAVHWNISNKMCVCVKEVLTIIRILLWFLLIQLLQYWYVVYRCTKYTCHQNTTNVCIGSTKGLKGCFLARIGLLSSIKYKAFSSCARCIQQFKGRKNS